MKVLAIPNAHALAHVTRVLEIAKVLRARGNTIVFAGHGKYLPVAAADGFPTHELPYISVEQIVQAVRSKKLWQLYPIAQLEGFIEDELALYEKLSPDLVLLDNRPTARTSAEKLGLKTAAVLNVHMSNYRRIPFNSYADIFGKTGGLGESDFNRFENWLERWAYDRLVMHGLNRIRRRMGLARLFAYDHEAGSQSFLADVPEFNPVMSALPASFRFVGPLTWHNDLPAPACLAQLDPDRPTVYLTLGSEGLDELVPELSRLTDIGAQVVVATGEAEFGDTGASPSPEGVFLEKFVNTDQLLPHCDLVCCHGGNGTLYQAFSFGLPVVVVATHAEQYYGGKRAQFLGLGRTMTLQHLRDQGFRSLVNLLRDVLNSSSYRANAKAFALRNAHWDAACSAADKVQEMLSE